MNAPRTEPVSDLVTDLVTDQVKQLLSCCREPKSSEELRQQLGLKHRTNFRNNYLKPALQAGLLEMTTPEKPNSRLQKYRLTEKGRMLLQEQTL